MTDFDDALRNIDVYCKVLAKKIVEEESADLKIEPIENLMRRKYIVDEKAEAESSRPPLISLLHLENPLVDVFEDDSNLKVLMQCHCKDETVTVHTDPNGLEICKKECYTDSQGSEICSDKCQKLDVPVDNLEVAKMVTKCSKNEVFEIEIPKKNS